MLPKTLCRNSHHISALSFGFVLVNACVCHSGRGCHYENVTQTIGVCMADVTRALVPEVYRRSFREIVLGSVDGLNGAILAYGQTSSGAQGNVITSSTCFPLQLP
eukprot:980080-Amphidinium_carterae.1